MAHMDLGCQICKLWREKVEVAKEQLVFTVRSQRLYSTQKIYKNTEKGKGEGGLPKNPLVSTAEN